MGALDGMALLVALGRPLSFAKGARLVRQGEVSRGAFFLRRGEVQVQVALPGGGVLAVGELGEGDLFGETALLERGVCSASVVARAEVEASFIRRSVFRAAVASGDAAALEMQRAVTRMLAAKLASVNARLLEHPAPEDRPAAQPACAGDPLAAVPRAGRPGFDLRAFLPVLPFFEGFDADEIDALAALARVLELERGAWLFAAGGDARACFLVVRGAVEVLVPRERVERRFAIAAPGDLVGHLALLRGAAHTAAARVRENACLLEFPAREFMALYEGSSSAAVRLQHAINRGMLRALAKTNGHLSRLIAAARLRGAREEGKELQAALGSQIVAQPPAAGA